MVFGLALILAPSPADSRNLWALVSVESPAAAGPGTDPSSVFEGYQRAFNAHDAEAMTRYWTADAVRIVDGKMTRVDHSHWSEIRAFEAATNARFRLSWRAASRGEYEVTLVEDCDFYNALGSRTKTTIIFVTLREGRFQRVRPQQSTDAGVAYGPVESDRSRYTNLIQAGTAIWSKPV